MDVAAPILIAVVAILGLLGIMALVRSQAQAQGWNAEVQRKLVHMATGLFAISLPWVFHRDWPVYLLLALTILVMAAMRLPALRNSGASEALHSVERQSYGDFLLAAGVALIFLLSNRDPLLYVLPLAVLTLGDAAAALAGSAYAKRFFAVEDGRKSVEGSGVLFLVTMILSMVCLLLFSQIARENVVILALLIAAFSTLVEADSWRGFDNLFLPLAVLVILREHGDSSAVALGVLALTFLAALLIYGALARRLGVSRHVARVHLVASFLLLSVTATQNAVLPLAMLVLHAVAERRAPSTDRYPALDAVAALAVLSVGWLALGNAVDLNALDFYGATMAGLCTALIALALSDRSIWQRLVAAVLMALVLVPFYEWMSGLNPMHKHWVPHNGLILAATLALCAGGAIIAPASFATQRMGRLSALAVVFPLIAFVVLAVNFGGSSP